MKQVLVLENRIKRYAWGSPTAISDLLGKPPPGDPEAELWIGAHPTGPSLARTAGGEHPEGKHPLDQLIARHPEEILGRETAARFGPALPFLFKVLAAAEPLSIQAHPPLAQAREGFARENEAGIPVDAPHRSYRDANHKPELIVALTEFWALKGFRPVVELVQLLDGFGSLLIEGELDALRRLGTDEALKRLFEAVFTLDRQSQAALAGAVAAHAGQAAGKGRIWEWIGRLDSLHPGDVGLVAALLLNLVRLAPGEGLYLAPGEPHAYLGGTGIEVMANSDNVLRGGLTAKHADVQGMMAALTFAGGPAAVIAPRDNAPGEKIYPTPAEEFALSEIRVGSDRWSSGPLRSVEVLLCVEGEGILSSGSGDQMPVGQGVSLLIPASIGEYAIEGEARFFRTSVPV